MTAKRIDTALAGIQRPLRLRPGVRMHAPGEGKRASPNLETLK